MFEHYCISLSGFSASSLLRICYNELKNKEPLKKVLEPKTARFKKLLALTMEI